VKSKRADDRCYVCSEPATVSPDLRIEDRMLAPYAPLAQRLETYPDWRELPSGHPHVFRCRFILDEKRLRHFIFEHTFYEGFRAWIASGPESALWIKP
jgi:hypothetical protein